MTKTQGGVGAQNNRNVIKMRVWGRRMRETLGKCRFGDSECPKRKENVGFAQNNGEKQKENVGFAQENGQSAKKT